MGSLDAAEYVVWFGLVWFSAATAELGSPQDWRKAGTNPWLWPWGDGERFLERVTLSAAPAQTIREVKSNSDEGSVRKDKGGMWDRAEGFPQNRLVETAVVVGSGSGPSKTGGWWCVGTHAARTAVIWKGRECTLSSLPPVCLYFLCIFNPRPLFHPAPSGSTFLAPHLCAASRSFYFCAVMTRLRSALVSLNR